MTRKTAGAAAAILAAALLFVSCGGETPSPWTPDNDIPCMRPVDPRKTAVTFGEFFSADTAPVAEALMQQFPEAEIITENYAAGEDVLSYYDLLGQNGLLPDVIFYQGAVPLTGYLYDLTEESFVPRYRRSALNAVAQNGRLYGLPVTDSATGIFYNKTLFQKNGWEVPETREEFFRLAETIDETGIRAFVPGLRYRETCQSVGLGFAHDEVFPDARSFVRYDEFLQGRVSCKGLLEPALEVLRAMMERDIIREEDFTASVTKVREGLYGGQVAMIPYSLDFIGFYEKEKPDCEIGFFAFPTDTPGERWLLMDSGCTVSVNARAMRDKAKRDLILKMLDYLSTPAGQKVLCRTFSGLGTLRNIDLNNTEDYPEIARCIDEGRAFYADSFGGAELAKSYHRYLLGEQSLGQTVAALDAAVPAGGPAFLEEAVLGTAEEPFTVLETSMLMADVLREKTGADVGLILNNSFYKGNLAQLPAGEIRGSSWFYLKGLGKQDAVTVYEITGKDLKELLEHPILYDRELDRFYAFSGLRATYAPLKKAGERVSGVYLENGARLRENGRYTVAAWSSTIDERYISDVLQEYPELGTSRELMTDAIVKAGKLRPFDDKRLTLDWTAG